MAGATSFATSATVGAVGGQVLAATVAIGLTRWAKTLARGTRLTTGTFRTTCTTIKIVGVGVAANSVALFLSRGTGDHTLAPRAQLTGGTRLAAATAVCAVSVQVFARTIAIGLTAWTRALS